MPNYALVQDGIITQLILIDPSIPPEPSDGWTRNRDEWTHPNLGKWVPWSHATALVNGYVGPTNLNIGDTYTEGDN